MGAPACRLETCPFIKSLEASLSTCPALIDYGVQGRWFMGVNKTLMDIHASILAAVAGRKG